MTGIRKLHRVKTIFAIAMFFAMFASTPCYGQGYRVQPMYFDLKSAPGATVNVALTVRNILPGGEQSLTARVVEITQASDGNWQIIEELKPGVDVPKVSCSSWVSLDKSEFRLGPLASSEIRVTVRIPRHARGTYAAGIIVEEAGESEESGVSVKLRYCIPVVVETEGLTAAQRIRLSDLSLSFEAPPEGSSEAGRTLAFVGVENQGQTFSSLRGQLGLFAHINGRWQPVSTAEIGPVRILPMVTLNLPFDLEKRLPEGRYRLEAKLQVEGRRIAPLSKEIEFAGTPGATTIPLDATLQLDKELLAIEARPGATRTEILTITNSSSETVKVSVGAQLPDAIFRGGSDEVDPRILSALPLLQAFPHEFTLRGQGKQNIRIMARVPRDIPPLSRRYADVILRATYPDGQSAGQAHTLAIVHDVTAEVHLSATIEDVKLAQDEEGQPLLNGRLKNTGNVHFAPVLDAVIRSGSGTVLARESLDTPEMLFPLQGTRFSAILPVKDLQVGQYELVVQLRGADQTVAQHREILMVEMAEDGTPSVSLRGEPAEKATPLAAESTPTEVGLSEVP